MVFTEDLLTNDLKRRWLLIKKVDFTLIVVSDYLTFILDAI